MFIAIVERVQFIELGAIGGEPIMDGFGHQPGDHFTQANVVMETGFLDFSCVALGNATGDRDSPLE